MARSLAVVSRAWNSACVISSQRSVLPSLAVAVAFDGFALGAVFVQFVAERADADLEHLGGLGAVAVGGF